MPSRLVTEQCGAGEGTEGVCTVKPSLRNSLANRDRRRSVLKLLAGTSLSDSKAVWRRDWRSSRCSWTESREEGMLVSPTQAGSPSTNQQLNQMFTQRETFTCLYTQSWKRAGPGLSGEHSNL